MSKVKIREKQHTLLITHYSLLTEGFTLLEVMIAVLIIATSFVVLLHSRNQSVMTADYASRVTIATLLASQKMGELEQDRTGLAGNDSGSFEDNPGYNWSTNISDTAYEQMKEVRVEVFWGEGKSKRSVELVNFVRKKEQ